MHSAEPVVRRRMSTRLGRVPTRVRAGPKDMHPLEVVVGMRLLGVVVGTQHLRVVGMPLQGVGVGMPLLGEVVGMFHLVDL